LERWLASGDAHVVSSEGLSKEEFVQEATAVTDFLQRRTGTASSAGDAASSEGGPCLLALTLKP
jgi:hypothetical protein